MQRFMYELLGDVGAVRISCVDEIDAEPGKSLQGPDCLGPVRGRAPDAAAGYTHRSEAEAIDLDITIDPE